MRKTSNKILSGEQSAYSFMKMKPAVPPGIPASKREHSSPSREKEIMPPSRTYFVRPRKQFTCADHCGWSVYPEIALFADLEYWIR